MQLWPRRRSSPPAWSAPPACSSSRGSETTSLAGPAPVTSPVPVRTDAYGRLRAFDVYYRDLIGERRGLVRRLTVTYRAWNGTARTAYVLLPRWYTAEHDPSLPLVIAPHGRGIEARDNLHFWGGLPAFGPFAVVSPEGQGRVLTRYSWGWRGQIDDLARMPAILARKLPWLRVDRRRIYAVGSSMGGQETLLLVARYPRLLAGAAALDSDTDLAARYRAFARLRNGPWLQELARTEMGGTPGTAPRSYALRSPVHWARGDRALRRSLAHLVEHGGPDRPRPARRVGAPVPAPPPAAPAGAGDRVRGALGAQPRVPRERASRSRSSSWG